MSKPEASLDPRQTAGAALLAGGVATLLTSACCVGPLVLLMVGITGAWIGYLVMLEPYQPVFLTLGVVALAVAGWQIWRGEQACDEGKVCARPASRWIYKLCFVVVAVSLAGSMAFPHFAHWFY